MKDRSETFAALENAVLTGEEEAAARLTRELLAAGAAPLELVDRALVPGIRRAGALWEEGEYFLPELITAAQAMKAAMALVRPLLEAATAPGARAGVGRVVIGTIQGDIHDIGKTLVATLLAANGFSVRDEGADVSVARFVESAREHDADLVCASALLTTTMLGQRELVAAVRGHGLRAKVVVGGAPVTRDWAREIGADGYAESAVTAVEVARGLLGHAAR
jgi:corrinoid protein of di/trimethylamine methyltransferase